MSIEFEYSPEYGQWIDRWNKIDSLVSGKIKHTAGEWRKYLAVPEYIDNPDDLKAKKQWNYINNARLLNVALRTLMTMRGMVATADSGTSIKLPAGMDYLLSDASGDGQSLEQMVLDSVYDVSRFGRQGLLVDAPSEEMTQADFNAGKGGARLVTYDARQIVDWREHMRAGVRSLSMIRLVSYWKDQQSYELKELYLDDDGLYIVKVETYEDGRLTTERYFEPTLGGARMRYIPFYWVGSIDNTSRIDTPPIESLVDINIGHLQNSAETEEAAFYLAPTGFVNIGDMSVDEYRIANPKGITLGASQVGVLGMGGSFSYIQPNPSNLSRELMADKERQMAYIGGQMIGVYTPETAEAARIQKRADMASLTTIVSNIESAYRKALQIALEWNGLSGDIVFELPRDFMTETIVSDNALTLIVNGVMAGSIPPEVQRQAFEQKYPAIEYPDTSMIGAP